MAKKGGVVPQFNTALGQASLGKIPGSNDAGPLTPYRLLGKDTSNDIANSVGALGSGTWSAVSPGQFADAFGMRSQAHPGAPGGSNTAARIAALRNQAVR